MSEIEVYLVTKKSKADLTYSNSKWRLPVTKPFDSLRRAKVYIKSNVGTINTVFTVMLATQIRTVEMTGTFEL